MRSWDRVSLTIVGVTLGSVVLSLGVAEVVAYAIQFTPTWKHYFFGVTVPMITTPLWAIPLVRANRRLNMLARELERQAHTDPLCGLPNRRAFFDSSTAVLQACLTDPNRLAVMMIDVDHFKTINDAHGHAAGDVVLSAIGGAIREAVAEISANTIVARIGGEEFAVLAIGLDRAGAERMAARICERVRGLRCSYGNAKLAATVSIGIAMRAPGDDIDATLRLADVAVYEAKEAGRNCCRFATGRDKLPVPLRQNRAA